MSIRYRHETQEAARGLATGLGWFSLALGAAQLAAPQQIARALGMRGSERMIQACGMREVATGVGILAARNPAPWLWGRVAGDALDLAGLAMGLHYGNRRRRTVGAAMGAVGAVTLLDLYAAQKMSEAAETMYLPAVDYSGRAGFPRGVEAARGAARDFDPGRHFSTPEALKPWKDGKPQNGWSEPGGGRAANRNVASASTVTRDTAVLGNEGGKPAAPSTEPLQQAAGSPKRSETFTIGQTFAGKGNEGP